MKRYKWIPCDVSLVVMASCSMFSILDARTASLLGIVVFLCMWALFEVTIRNLDYKHIKKFRQHQIVALVVIVAITAGIFLFG